MERADVHRRRRAGAERCAPALHQGAASSAQGRSSAFHDAIACFQRPAHSQPRPPSQLPAPPPGFFRITATVPSVIDSPMGGTATVMSASAAAELLMPRLAASLLPASHAAADAAAEGRAVAVAVGGVAVAPAETVWEVGGSGGCGRRRRRHLHGGCKCLLLAGSASAAPAPARRSNAARVDKGAAPPCGRACRTLGVLPR